MTGIRRTTIKPRALGLADSRMLRTMSTAQVDPYYANTSLLLNMQGANNGTTFKDNSKNDLAVTANGTAKTITSQARFGVSSLLLDGSSTCYLSTATSSEFAITGDFTVELSIYIDTTGSSNYTLLHVNAGAAQGLHLYYSSSRLLIDNGLVASYTGPSGFLPASTWLDLAICKIGTILYISKGSVVSDAITAQDYGTPNRCQVGRYSTGSITNNAAAKIGYVRVTKGVSRLIYPVATALLPAR